jgi:hypothetical protein
VFWGFLACTGPTGVRATLWKLPGFTSRDQSGRCRSIRLEVCVPLRSQVSEVRCWSLGPVALQWLRGLDQLE